MTQHHGSPDDPSPLSGEGVEAIASALPGAEAVLAPLARQEFASFLLDLGSGRILAATSAAARLAIAPGEPAPEPVTTTAARLARRTAAGFGVARLRLPGDLSPRTLRFAALALPSGPALLFADPAAFAPAAPSPVLPAAAPAVPAALRPLLAQPLRVTWESDAEGRLRALSPLFAAALGSRSGTFLGASFADLERDGHLTDADALIDAMASGESFTERTATVPPVGVESPLDLSLGGAPLFDAERRLRGVRGFGIVTAAEAPLPQPPKAPQASAPAPQPPVAFGRNVVPLRQGSLSPQESSAFREIARTLAAAIEDWPRIPPDNAPPDNLDAAYAEPEPPPASGDEAELLDKLPVSLLVQQEGELVHANRAFLALTGWSGLDALAEAGGLERVLSRESGALHVLTPDGARLPVEVRLVAAPFLGRPALIHVIRALDTTDDDREARASARRAALDMVPWPVFLLEMDGTIRLANFAAAERLGFPAHDLAGEPFTTAVAPTDRADAVATLDRVRDDGASAQVALALRNREGELLPGLAAVTRAGAEDQILCVVIGPVPQQPELAPMAVPEPEPATNLLPRLAGRLRAGLEGPMAILREAPAEALSDPLRDALKSLNAMLDDLNALSKPAAPVEAVTCDVSAAVRAAVAALLPAARRRRLALRLDDAGGVTAQAAEAPLADLVAMLVEEAVAATPAGGAVAVSVFTEDEGDKGPRAKVQLSDAGAGLDATAAAAALDPLSGLSPDDRFAAEGRPLRLTRMAEAARALGGTLEIDPVGMNQAGEDLGRRRGMIARLTLPA
ncbi:PAS domain-containing protein [Xanthobacter sp. SG618]|uniref:PAS domain-containing protein n=1 Tax=Xanthobacter sp. SG618 TaxID=2587121 RepID=UPI00145FABA5|nr:PAS domain-containing protein [Xanthobacter sp. SG618]NMN56822.1 PAS domain-containing protein [Xanthobacter sp. SG618]